MTEPVNPRIYIDDVAEGANPLNRSRYYEPPPVRRRYRPRAPPKVHCKATTRRNRPCGNGAGPNGFCHVHDHLFIPPPSAPSWFVRFAFVRHLPASWQPVTNRVLNMAINTISIAIQWVAALVAGLMIVPVFAAGCVLAYFAMLTLFGLAGAGVEMLSMASD